MPLASWYLHKADQCTRMAKDATDPHRRASYKEEQKLWLIILAEHLEVEEKESCRAAIQARRLQL
jgi:hypothetical protein